MDELTAEWLKQADYDMDTAYVCWRALFLCGIHASHGPGKGIESHVPGPPKTGPTQDPQPGLPVAGSKSAAG